MKTIILDTDPGVDDALAITLACFSRIRILGITTVYGNATVFDSTRNALTILQILNKNIPVFEGAQVPLLGQNKNATAHGENGLGGFFLSGLRRKKSKMDAISFLIDQLTKRKNKSITIIAIGPCTNVALLAVLRPDLVKKIKELIILGGVFFEKGNISPFAEFNAFNDPYSFQKLLTFNCRKIVIPINICRKVFFTREDFDKIKNKKIKNIFNKISEIYIQYYTSNNPFGSFKGGVMYDLLAIAYLLKPFLFNRKEMIVKIETRSVIKYGKTFISRKGIKNCEVITNVDGQQVKKIFFDTINGAGV